MTNLDNVMSYIDISDATAPLTIDIMVRQVCDADWSWDHGPEHWRERVPSLLVWLVHRGDATLETSRGRYDVKRGDFLVMPSVGIEYHGRHTAQALFDVTWLFFRAPTVQGVLAGARGLPFYSSLRDVSFVEGIMSRLLTSGEDTQGTWLRALLDEVRRQSMVKAQSVAERQMQELGERIQANPGHYRGLDDMLGDYHYSKDHLIRLFRGHHGLTPIEFLIRARVDSARGLLRASTFSMKQIAAQLGYADPFCFSRQFKARTGVSPSVFRCEG